MDGKRLYYRYNTWNSTPGVTIVPVQDLQNYPIRMNPAIMGDHKVVFILDTIMNGNLDNCGVSDSVSFNVPSNCALRLTINGVSGDRTASEYSPVKLELHVTANNLNNTPCDWWVYVDSPSGRLYYDMSNGWKPGERVAYQGVATNVPAYVLLNYGGLAAGEYTFHVILDNVKDGILDGVKVETTTKLTLVK